MKKSLLACLAAAASMSMTWIMPVPVNATPPAAVAQRVDVASLAVTYRGRSLSYEQAESLRQRRENAGRRFVLVYDPVSSASGVAHAFDSPEAADSFWRAQKNAAPTAAASAVAAAAVTPMALPTGCPDARNISRMYDYTNCGGSNFNFLLTDNEPTFGPTGWNNRGTSLVVGWASTDCTILIRLYPGPNYTYTEARFYGGTSATYYAFTSASNNNFESGRSTCS